MARRHAALRRLSGKTAGGGGKAAGKKRSSESEGGGVEEQGQHGVGLRSRWWWEVSVSPAQRREGAQLWSLGASELERADAEIAAMIVAATVSAALAPPPCPRTFADCIDGARAALRHAREQEWRLVSIELPYLPPDVAIADRLQPQPPWPGGVAQQHRNGLRPVADGLLRGYDAEFAGLIEVGTGVWRCGPSMTAVSHVSWANFRAYAKLRNGEFGEAPTRSDHTILLLNPSSRLSVANIGQPWDVDLRREAASASELAEHMVGTTPSAGAPHNSWVVQVVPIAHVSASQLAPASHL